MYDMQPFEYVILLFFICLIHGIHRAVHDIKQEAYRDAFFKRLRESLSESDVQIIGTLDCPGGTIVDGKELHGYLSKDCIS